MLTNKWKQMKLDELDQYGIKPALFLLLTATGYRQDVVRLHDEHLPANAQLMQKDLVALERFWTKMCQVGATKKGRISPYALQWMIQQVLPEHGLTRYYRDKLFQGRKKGHELTDLLKLELVCSQVDVLAYGYHHFDAHFESREVRTIFKMELDVRLSEDRQKLDVCISIWEHNLTKPITRCIQSFPNDMKTSITQKTELNFWINLEAAPFMDYMIQQAAPAFGHKLNEKLKWDAEEDDMVPWWVAQDGFTDLLVAKLQEAGLTDLQFIQPYLPEPEENQAEGDEA